MGCISSAPVEPEGDEFEGDPLADLKRRKRDHEQEVKGAQEYGQALLASQAELLQAQAQKEQDRKKRRRKRKSRSGRCSYIQATRSNPKTEIVIICYMGQSKSYFLRTFHFLQLNCVGLTQKNPSANNLSI